MPASGRVAILLLTLIGVWTLVFWLWEPSRPRVTAASGEAPVISNVSGELVARNGESIAPEPLDLSRPQAVVPPSMRRHVIQKGETLATISRGYFGSESYAEAIARANPTLSPPDLKAGREILVPIEPSNIRGRVLDTQTTREALAKDESPAPIPEYVVQSGDSLSTIAKKVYGSSQHAEFIFEQNRDRLRNRNMVRAGMTLRVPALRP
ncbi:MAG: LysM peptidoglycan-binding domain-containing protein [Phycisphaerales bacterium]|nr:MAG: LysM peptidoglycan-binding domain-containing protein [Phycisphaerales bacterium]